MFNEKAYTLYDGLTGKKYLHVNDEGTDGLFLSINLVFQMYCDQHSALRYVSVFFKMVADVFQFFCAWFPLVAADSRRCGSDVW